MVAVERDGLDGRRTAVDDVGGRALSVLLFGAVVGLYFQRTGRLFPAVAAHVIADAVGLGSM